MPGSIDTFEEDLSKFADDVGETREAFEAEDTGEEASGAEVASGEESAESEGSEQELEAEGVETPEEKSEAAQRQAAVREGAARPDVNYQELFEGSLQKALQSQSAEFQRQQEESVKRHRAEMVRMNRQMKTLQAAGKKKAQEASQQSALPSVYDWIKDGGDPETHRLLSAMEANSSKAARPSDEFQQMQREIRSFKMERQKERQKSEYDTRHQKVDSHFRSTVAEAGEVHARFKSAEWSGVLNGLVFASGFNAANSGKEPTSAMDAVGIAKKLDVLIKREAREILNTRVSKTKSANSSVASAGKGGGSRPGVKKGTPKSSDEAIDAMFDGLF